VLDGHARVGGVQAADVLVIEAASSADENFIEGPLAAVLQCASHGLHSRAASAAERRRCFSA
jgi:hypothetical protein